jgi:hypothetical protein
MPCCLLTADLSFENRIWINILIITVTSQPDTTVLTHAFCRHCLSPPHKMLLAFGSVAARVSPSTIRFIGSGGLCQPFSDQIYGQWRLVSALQRSDLWAVAARVSPSTVRFMGSGGSCQPFNDQIYWQWRLVSALQESDLWAVAFRVSQSTIRFVGSGGSCQPFNGQIYGQWRLVSALQLLDLWAASQEGLCFMQ